MSKKLEAMTEAYRLLLASISVVPQSDDLLVQDIDDMKTQVLVDGKPLALPTDKIVNNYSDSMVVFHPLCENLLLGESPVLQELRNLIMESLNNLIVQTIDSILMIAVDDNFEDLTPNQIEFMRCTSGADNTTLKNWRSIARRIDARSSANRVVTIFLKRGAMFKGSKCKRVANVNFNLYNKLDQNTATVIGAKVRKADLKVYSAIFEALFKHIESDDEYYSAGTDALIAPYFTVLVESYYKVLKDVNSATWLLRKPIEKVSGRKLHVNDDFMGHLDNLQQYRDVLPVMPLNDGDRNVNREEEQNRNNLNNNTAPLPTNTVNNQQAITNMAQQANPYYDTPVVADVVVNTEPVQSPQFNQQLQQQQPQPTNNQSNAFPSLEAQLNGVPLSGMPQGHGFMNPYAQPQMNPYAMQNPQMNPYAQPQPQMNPYAQAQPQMNPYAQPQMQMNPYAMQNPQMNPYAQPQPQMNPYNQMQPNMGHPNGFKL